MPEPSLSRAVVLAVEDHEVSRYVLARNLTRSGYDVLEASNGAEAIQHAPSADVILMDVDLPDIKGYEVCRRLKQDPATEHVPVIFLTATAWDPASIETGKQAGGIAYLCEPVEHETLIQVIKHALFKL